jgi:hypothetical protein
MAQSINQQVRFYSGDPYEDVKRYPQRVRALLIRSAKPKMLPRWEHRSKDMNDLGSR